MNLLKLSSSHKVKYKIMQIIVVSVNDESLIPFYDDMIPENNIIYILSFIWTKK